MPADLRQLSIDTIRVLAMDAVQKANAGHPGTAMALAPVAYTIYRDELRANPERFLATVQIGRYELLTLNPVRPAVQVPQYAAVPAELAETAREGLAQQRGVDIDNPLGKSADEEWGQYAHETRQDYEFNLIGMEALHERRLESFA